MRSYGFVLFLAVLFSFSTAAGKNVNTVPLKTYKFLPELSDRAAWEQVKKSPEKKQYIETIFREAEIAAAAPVPQDSAKLFMEFVRNGNRSNYETKYFERRSRLMTLVLAEALEYKGRFMDDIIEYLYAIEAEYTWAVPAHTGIRHDVLPMYKYEEIELFSAETANLVAQTLAICEKELTRISPNFVKRLKAKVMERAVIPVEENLQKYWWKDLLSNWNPWICANLFWAGNYALQGDHERFTKFGNKLLAITERYYKHYPADGACEEGALYFSRSPENYFLFLEGMYHATEGRFNRYGEMKMRKMFEFISAANMGGNYFATFSDARKNVSLSSGMLYAMAERVNSPVLRTFSENYAPFSKQIIYSDPMGYMRPYYQLFGKADARQTDNNFFLVYPETQHAYLRNGNIALAVKGGHNAEEHNHIDIGQFILKLGDKTVAIDLGAATYTKDYFNENRYKNFVTNSFGHNHLIFNGVGQGLGKNFRTASFETSGDFNHAEIVIDMSPAYPAELKLKSCKRKIIFDRGELTLIDEFEAAEKVSPLMTIYSEFAELPVVTTGKIKSEVYEVTDDSLRKAWGNKLYKHTVTIDDTAKGCIKTVFKLQNKMEK